MTSEWALVVLTGVYVLATIAIYRANQKSAKWAQAQTDELIRQFRETNRARLSVRFDKRAIVERSFVIKNIGQRPATNVRLSIDGEFMSALDKVFPANVLKIAQKSTILIAPGQEFWFLVGMCSTVERMSVQVAHIRVAYRDGEQNYLEETVIDLKQYDFLTEVSTKTIGGKPV